MDGYESSKSEQSCPFMCEIASIESPASQCSVSTGKSEDFPFFCEFINYLSVQETKFNSIHPYPAGGTVK